MQEIISGFFSVYIKMGYLIALWVIIMFILTGRHIFGHAADLVSYRDSVGYVFSMLLLMPVFYSFYIKEIYRLHKKLTGYRHR
ncbi:hypothetical protein EB241_11080 [Erwinia psidii]|uniref:Uncharacterized protein n=1 Tax=Erwinia psidii TaxID=69224 RepID=A0A3N6UQN3_9GAMM|nr:hypothetical protein EB241_11080 [Erwinia psidii]